MSEPEVYVRFPGISLWCIKEMHNVLKDTKKQATQGNRKIQVGK